MIYTKSTKRAMNIAYRAHKNQFDKAGVPYIYHPMHLAEQMETEEECIVALLHDVVEDTSVTFEQLAKEFPESIINAIHCLTHEKTVPYLEYVKKIKANPIARKVKLADLHHNADETRLEKLMPKDKLRILKYQEAIRILEE